MSTAAVQRYPLSWPTGWKRTSYGLRRTAAFSRKSASGFKERLDVSDGLNRIYGELRRLGARDVILSSNLRLKDDGWPYASQAKRLDDPGIAVYFKLKGAPRVLACDQWNSAADNLAAIAGHIEAIRAMDRYGVGTLDQAFAGYTALAANNALDWRAVFGIPELTTPTMAMVDERFKAAARTAHPDAGGSHLAMTRLNEAREAARRELEASR